MANKLTNISAVTLLCWSMSTASFEITVDGSNGATSGTWIPSPGGFVVNSFEINVSNNVVLTASDTATLAIVSAYSTKGSSVCGGSTEVMVSCSSGSSEDAEEECDVDEIRQCLVQNNLDQACIPQGCTAPEPDDSGF